MFIFLDNLVFLNFYVKLLFNDNTDEYFRDKLLFSFKLGQKQKQAECLSQFKKKKTAKGKYKQTISI